MKSETSQKRRSLLSLRLLFPRFPPSPVFERRNGNPSSDSFVACLRLFQGRMVESTRLPSFVRNDGRIRITFTKHLLGPSGRAFQAARCQPVALKWRKPPIWRRSHERLPPLRVKPSGQRADLHSHSARRLVGPKAAVGLTLAQARRSASDTARHDTSAWACNKRLFQSCTTPPQSALEIALQ